MRLLNGHVNSLKELTLSSYPVKDIKSVFEKFGVIGIIKIPLNEGKSIIRARPNENEPFNKISELSYKPAKYNTRYQRASTPNTTMFYGCVAPDNIVNDEPYNEKVTAIYEASKLLRQGIIEGEEKITFSRWIVKKDFSLVAIVYHKDFIDKYSHTRELSTAHQNFLKLHPNVREKSMLVTEFIASEFAKNEIQSDFDYLISALFTEKVLSLGFAGVYYPSVRTEGQGINVAIAPHFVENNMEPVFAGECTLYKKGNCSVLDNDKICELNAERKDFTFGPIEPWCHKGREECYKILNKESTI